jgi:hypothetical protein
MVLQVIIQEISKFFLIFDSVNNNLGVCPFQSITCDTEEKE